MQELMTRTVSGGGTPALSTSRDHYHSWMDPTAGFCKVNKCIIASLFLTLMASENIKKEKNARQVYCQSMTYYNYIIYLIVNRCLSFQPSPTLDFSTILHCPTLSYTILPVRLPAYPVLPYPILAFTRFLYQPTLSYLLLPQLTTTKLVLH